MHDTPDLSFDPCFLDAPDELFQHLVASVEWDTRMRARRTASFGVAYNYSQIDYPATSLPDALQALCERLHRRLGFLPNNCLLNLYEDGQSSMGFHSDDCSELAADTGVAILSLGSARPIHFRSKADRQRKSPGSCRRARCCIWTRPSRPTGCTPFPGLRRPGRASA